MKAINLTRIDQSGVFALPNDIAIKDVCGIELNGAYILPEEYTFTEDGNIDVTGSDVNSIVTAVVDVE